MRVRLVLLGSLFFVSAACGSSSESSSPADDSGTDAIAFDSGVGAAEVATDAPSDGPTADERAAFDKLLATANDALKTSGTPGASIAVVLHGKLTFAAGVGVKNVKSGEAVTTSTLFRAASMSKMIVAATAMTLVDEGKLDLEAPITNYLPWFTLQSGFDATKITTSMLLSHSSGFPCDTIPFCDATSNGTRKAYFSANPQPLWAPPGATYDYSNAGFALAATVIESAAGSADGSYEQLAHDRVLAPVGMTTATFDAKAARALDHATGYQLDATGKVIAIDEPSTLDCAMLHPPGGINATATDYAHFAEMLIANGGAVLKPPSVAAMESPHADMHTFADQEYGYGLIDQKTPYPDHTVVWHDGALPGFLSEMLVVPDLGVAVVVMINASPASSDPADQIAVEGLADFIAEKFTTPTLTTPSTDWAKYVGVYDDAFGTLGAKVTVTLSGSTLSIDAPNSVDVTGAPAPVHGAMKQIAVDTWSLPDGTAMAFFPDASGSTKYFVTRRGTAIKE